MSEDPGQGGGDSSQQASDAGQEAAQKAVKGLQTAAKEGKNVAEQVAAGGTRVDIWLKWAKKYALPLIGFLMVLALATAAIAIFAIASVVSSVFGDKGGACASGATDLAILATSGPVNVGDKFNNPRGGVTTISQEMMGNAQIIVRAGLDYKPNPMSTNGMVIAIGVSLMEAGLINNPGGDASSVGLFQQLALHGSYEQRHNPQWSSNHFYNMLNGTKGWQSMTLGLAADKTQRPGKRSEALYQGYMPTAAGLVQSILAAFDKNTATVVSQTPESTNRPVLATLSFLNVNQRLGQSTGPAAPTDPNAPASADPAAANPDCSMGDAGGGAMGDATGATGFEPGPNGTQVPIANVPGIGRINATIAVQVTNMLAKAKSEGVNLTGGSYRSHASQIQLRIAHCGSSQYAIWEMRSSSCRPPTAVPGRSQHELGLAIDFSNCSSRSSACHQWLKNNAGAFGLINLPSEPWHWSTTGR